MKTKKKIAWIAEGEKMLRWQIAVPYALGLGIVNSTCVHSLMELKREAVEESVGHNLKQTVISVLSLFSGKDWKNKIWP